MGILDQLSKTITQGVDRARFEAEKFQRTTKLQSEVNDLRRQLDEKMVEMGQRAYDLQRAGQINAPSIGELAQLVDQLRAGLLGREEELKRAQLEVFPEPAPGYTPPAQSVPVSYETPPPPAPTPPPAASAAPAQPQGGLTPKSCPNCGFQMPGSAMFCPSCGSRVSA